MTSEQSFDPMAGLKVSLEQKASDPPVVSVLVTNNNPDVVTILSYDSPLDSLAFALGMLSITPKGADAPLDIPRIQLRRVWPPTTAHLITIAPGETTINDVELRPAMVSRDRLGDEPSVQLRSEWQAVWMMRKDQVSKESLENPRFAPDAFRGSVLTDPIELSLS